MSLDSEPMKVSTALKIASKYYEQKTFDHALRVARYVAENDIIPFEYRDECVALAIMHDLVEDTEYKPVGLPENFEKSLDILTKQKEISYDDYCKKIKDTGHINYRMCAYWVKLADMKDHLSLTDTLTDKLKNKYLSGLRFLL